jgi:hypothetical protein
METTRTTVVTQLINRARSELGEIDELAVPHELFDDVYAEVIDAGGGAGFDHCLVDGVRVTAQADDTPTAVPAAGGERVPLG